MRGAEIAPSTINVRTPIRHMTHCLQRGVQAQMVDAAKLANIEGCPINRVLTVRTSGMVTMGEGGILRNHGPAKRVFDFLDRYRPWCIYRKIPVYHIWVREYGSHHGDHFHMGYHMPAEHDHDYAAQLADWFEEAIRRHDGSDAIISTSELNSWQIRGCLRGNTTGRYIAAYLGKSEPNDYTDGWDKQRINTLKHRRGYKGGEGEIEGTTKHHARWGTSLPIGRDQRDRNKEWL